METVHITFDGGGLVLPLQDAYDQEHLAQHAAHQAHRTGQVEVRIDGRRWTVERQERPDGRCEGCERPLGFVAWRSLGLRDPSCASCALIGTARADRTAP